MRALEQLIQCFGQRWSITLRHQEAGDAIQYRLGDAGDFG